MSKPSQYERSSTVGRLWDDLKSNVNGFDFEGFEAKTQPRTLSRGLSVLTDMSAGRERYSVFGYKLPGFASMGLRSPSARSPGPQRFDLPSVAVDTKSPYEGGTRRMSLRSLPSLSDLKTMGSRNSLGSTRFGSFLGNSTKSIESTLTAHHGQAHQSCVTRMVGKFFELQPSGCIRPMDRSLMRWYLISALATCYTVAVSPVRAAFLQWSRDEERWLLALDVLATAVHVFDLVLHFFIGLSERNGHLLYMNRSKIRKRYLLSWFAVDVLAVIPVEAIFAVVRHAGGRIGPMQTLFLLRSLKGLKVSKLSETLGNEYYGLNRALRQCVVLTVAVPLISHVLTCTWFVVTDDLNQGWAVGETLLDAYVAGFYWTVSTLTAVGFGSLGFQRPEQQALGTVVSLLGTIFSGLVIAKITHIVTDWNQTRTKLSERTKSIKAYLRYRRVPKPLQRRITNYFHQFYLSRSTFDEQNILGSLNSRLRLELSIFILRESLDDLAVFRGILTPSLIGALVKTLKAYQAQDNEVVIEPGTPVEEIFFVLRGEATVFDHDRKTVLAVIGPGSHFGEINIFEPVRSRKVHELTVRATSKMDVYILDQKSLMDIAAQFPTVKARLQALEKQRKATYYNLRVRNIVKKDEEEQRRSETSNQRPPAKGNIHTPHNITPARRMRNSFSYVQEEDDGLKMLSINSELVNAPGHSNGVPVAMRSERQVFITEEQYITYVKQLHELKAMAAQQAALIRQLRTLARRKISERKKP